MKNLRTYLGGIAMLALGLCFTACSDDDGPEYSKTVLQNTELKSILVSQGYQFNEQGNLLLDDKANQTTSLDLSNTNISQDALSELSILPNLTDVNLSNNGYTKSFDFSKLPAQITGVDLTGNELYEYPGLLNIVTQENGDEDVTVLRNLTKLYLPESAKYNCDEIPTYFANVSGVDMKMANASGTLETYTTLREVPDEELLSYLKNLFPSLFDGDKIDISKRLVKIEEQAQNITLSGISTKIQNPEGVQYVLMNKGYNGSTFTWQSFEQNVTLKGLKVKSCITKLNLVNMDTPYLDLSEASNLFNIKMTYNPSLTQLDLSNNKSFGQKDLKNELSGLDGASKIDIGYCDNLSEILFPAKASLVYSISLYRLNSLISIDLSQFETMYKLTLGAIPLCKIVYPTIQYWTKGGEINNENGKMYFGITESVYNLSETQIFLDKYHDHFSYTGFGGGDPELVTYNWRTRYQ